MIVGFRVDGAAAITRAPSALVVVDLTSGRTASIPLSAQFGGGVRLR